MKVHNIVKLKMTKEEKDAIQIVYNMFYRMELGEEHILNKAITTPTKPTTIADVRDILFKIWELGEFDINIL